MTTDGEVFEVVHDRICEAAQARGLGVLDLCQLFVGGDELPSESAPALVHTERFLAVLSDLGLDSDELVRDLATNFIMESPPGVSVAGSTRADDLVVDVRGFQL